ncbi:DUF6896 domain-containing protein [Mixta intestinalis]|uniref:DUF6896 domain-containing protein n=1 Tax=Mixta intestinalis TaxID=1615494 RepID=A0A6P1PXU4_9GAMM|nr:hypothetical protein [Mixta intestinalis]QHM71406.1 hypothetical protein C7M51_01693 [Mixta intestinalis]
MNENFYLLIVEFQENVQAALKLMYRSGIKMPSSRSEWIESDIPSSGELEGGVKYYKHGAGCWVGLDSGEVDFDFGLQGKVGGFNAWWLTRFAGNNIETYGFRNFDDIFEHINKALADGELIYPEHDLYYIANVPYTYAIDTDSRNSGDMLPSRNHDRVLTLKIHYFETAELMFKNYDKLDQKMQRNGYLSQREEIEMRIYLSTWLGFLGVVCEGFRKLNMRVLLDNNRPIRFKELLPISDSIRNSMKKTRIHSGYLEIMFFILEKITGLHIIFLIRKLNGLYGPVNCTWHFQVFFRSIEFSVKCIVLLMGVKAKAIDKEKGNAP